MSDDFTAVNFEVPVLIVLISTSTITTTSTSTSTSVISTTSTTSKNTTIVIIQSSCVFDSPMSVISDVFSCLYYTYDLTSYLPFYSIFRKKKTDYMISIDLSKIIACNTFPIAIFISGFLLNEDYLS